MITFSDKLKKGKRDGTPEKTATPNLSQETGEDGTPGAEKRPAIMDDEILAMQIKPESFEKVIIFVCCIM